MRVIFSLQTAVSALTVLMGVVVAPAANAAIPAEVPVVLVMSSKTYNLGDSGGLIGGLVSNAANEVGDAQVAEFGKRTAGVDWVELAQEEFACFAVSDQQAAGCRRVLVADAHGVDEVLMAEGVQRAIVVELLQTFRTAIRYRARAVVREVSLGKRAFRDDRVFTALYESHLPKAMWNNTVSEAEAWWAEGTPSRLEADARRSLRELRELLEMLEPLTEDKWSVPKEWRQLPKVATLVDAGRAFCAGLPCNDVRVLAEKGERVWLVNDRPLLPVYGPSVASLDEHSLANQTNLFILVTIPH